VAAAHEEVGGWRRLEDARVDVLGQRSAQVRIVKGSQVLRLRSAGCSYLTDLDRKIRLAKAASRNEGVIWAG
jgi:hypothetical protein